jgi:uncharacterized OB-fold protein
VTLRAALIGNDDSMPCELCGNAVSPRAALCVRCQRQFALDAANEANALAYETSAARQRELREAREQRRRAM